MYFLNNQAFFSDFCYFFHWHYKNGYDIIYLSLQKDMEEYPSPVEGIGLENQEVAQAAQGFESLFLRH